MRFGLNAIRVIRQVDIYRGVGIATATIADVYRINTAVGRGRGVGHIEDGGGVQNAGGEGVGARLAGNGEGNGIALFGRGGYGIAVNIAARALVIERNAGAVEGDYITRLDGD